MRKCPNCGMENNPSANFCGGCGTQLLAEAPGESQASENTSSAARSAVKPSGKKFWKIAVPAFVLIAAVLLFRGTGQSHSCPDCDEILNLQEQLQEVMAENEDDSLILADYERWNAKVSTLSNEIQLLKDHECDMPIRKVKNQEYAYGRYEGTYTGEWKSTAPYGEGVFSGSYRTGATQYMVSYSGEWSGGAPNGTGSLMQHREYVGSGSQENWNSWLYEGTFANGKLTGSGWSSMESSTGDHVEYYNGVYRDGFLQGQADFLQYRDGKLYDKGVVEGLHYVPIYSARQEVLNALNTAGAIVVAGIAAKGLFDVIDITLNGTDSKSFQNSSAGRWLASESASIAAEMEQWQKNKEKEATKQQLQDTWKVLEDRVRWCETSPYDYVREDTDYFRSQAAEAKRAYDAF